MSQMGQGLVVPVLTERIGIWSHRLGRYSHAEYVEVVWVADAKYCGVILQHGRA